MLVYPFGQQDEAGAGRQDGGPLLAEPCQGIPESVGLCQLSLRGGLAPRQDQAVAPLKIIGLTDLYGLDTELSQHLPVLMKRSL